MAITIFENNTLNISSPWLPVISQGTINLYVSGDLGGGILTMEALSPDGVSIVPVNGGIITAPGLFLLEAGSFAVRGTLTGSALADISVYIEVESVVTRMAVRRRV